PNSRRTSAPTFISMALSSTCSPVVRRSVATSAVVAAVPPTTSGAQPERMVRAASDRLAKKSRGEVLADIKACLREAGHQCRRTERAAKEYGLLECAWCGRAARTDGCRCPAACCRFRLRLFQ